MIDLERLTVEKKKTWVLGLMIGCPAGKPMETCPARVALLDIITPFPITQLWATWQ